MVDDSGRDAPCAPVAATDDLTQRPLFFYGTLQDRELLATVLDRADLSDLSATPAVLPDHRLDRVHGESFPMVFASPGHDALGLVVEGLSVRERERVMFFEDADYALFPVSVRTCDGGVLIDAAAFGPTEKILSSGEAWRIEDWPADEKALLIECAREQLSYLGRIEQALVEVLWPDIKARAEARLGLPTTLRSPPANGDASLEIEPGTRAPEITVDVSAVRHASYGGGVVAAQRDTVQVGDRAAVLPFDPKRDLVLLIEQFRPAGALRADSGGWLIELPAGGIEPGEAEAAAARREAQEEAGVSLGRLERVGRPFNSPGEMALRTAIFVGEADLSAADGVFGASAEGEDIRAFATPFWEAMTALHRGDVDSAPAMIALYWLARNRERLQLLWR